MQQKQPKKEKLLSKEALCVMWISGMCFYFTFQVCHDSLRLVRTQCKPHYQHVMTFFFITYCLTLRQIKGNCAESFTEYWTCLDYSNLAELRHCRKQQKEFDSCVLEKLGWERPELGDLSKVGEYIRCFVILKLSNLYQKWFRCLFGHLVHILYFKHVTSPTGDQGGNLSALA